MFLILYILSYQIFVSIDQHIIITSISAMSTEYTTHVANAYSEEIAARVDVNKRLTTSEKTGEGFQIGAEGFSIGASEILAVVVVVVVCFPLSCDRSAA